MFNYNDASNFGIKEEALFKDNAKTALKEYKGRFKNIEADFNARYLEVAKNIEEFNSKFFFLRSQERGRQLQEEVGELVQFAETFNDPSLIEAQNQQWLRNTLEILDDEGGPFAGELKAAATEGYLIASTYGVRIAEDKVKQEAFIQLDAFDGRFRQAINNNDMQNALQVQHEREAALNSFVVEGIFSKNEAQAFLKNSKNQYADAILVQSLGHNYYVEASESRDAALKHLKGIQKISSPFFKRASDKVKTNFLNRLANLKEMTLDIDVSQSQFEYSQALFNWTKGGTTSKQIQAYTNRYRNDLKKALSSGLFKTASAKAKANRELERIAITNRLVLDAAKAGEELAQGTALTQPLLNFNKTSAAVAKHYGFSIGSEGTAIIDELRSSLDVPKGDKVASNVALYQFALGAAGKDDKLTEVESLADLRIRMAQVRKMDTLMGGAGDLDITSADAFRSALEQGADPDLVGTMVQENPELLADVAKARSKPEFIATSTSVREFMTVHNNIFNFSNADASALFVNLQQNTNAKQAYENIFSYLESEYEGNEELEEFLSFESVGTQQFFSSIANVVYRDLIASQGSAGDSNKLLNEKLKNVASWVLGKRGAVNSVQESAGELADSYIQQLINNQRLRGQVNVTFDPYLQRDSTLGNLVVDAFSYQPNSLGTAFTSLFSNKNKNIEYKELENYITSLLGDNTVDISGGKLRLRPHSNSIYRLSYTVNGTTRALRDANGDYIFLDASLIDLAEPAIPKEYTAEAIMELIKRSNR